MDNLQLWLQGIGSIISLGVVGLGTWFVLKSTKSLQQQNQLVTVIIYSLCLLIGVYVIDKIVAVKIEILSLEENQSLFSFIQDIVLIVFGYFFGTKSKS